MHALVLSDTFPNRVDPWRGPYNRRQMECLSRLCRLTVVNPLPWQRMLPGGRWHGLAAGRDDVLDGIELYHPRLLYVPVIGRGLSWWGVYRAARRVLKDLPEGRFDLVMTTYGYPHGYAAMRLAGRLGLPYVVKVRGSDLHTVPRESAHGRQTAEALRNAAAVVAVSRNLADAARGLGAREDRTFVLTNGIDADEFPLVAREEARRGLGLGADAGRILLMVGNILPVKGLDVLLDALSAASGPAADGARPTLVVAGKGPMREQAEKQAARNGLGDVVRFLGHVAREDVASWMNAADAVVLPSRREGCPNVVLEALSCGTPVVASRVGAVPDLLDENCGIIVEPEDAGALGQAIRAALTRQWDRAALRRHVESMSWESNARKLYSILSAVAGGSHCSAQVDSEQGGIEGHGHEPG